MDLKAAIAKVEGMKNLYRAFEDVEGVLRLAAQAENLAKERQAEADRLGKENESLRAHRDNLLKLIANDEAEREQARHKGEADMLAVEQRVSEIRAQRLAEFETQFSRALAVANEHEKKLEAEIRDLAERKGTLEAEVTTLSDELNRLKSRIAGV